MKVFNNMKIGKKMSIGLILVAIFSNIIGYTGIPGIIKFVISILFSIGIGIIYSKVIGGQIRNIIAGAKQMVSGNLRTHVGINTKDELGELAATLNQFTDILNLMMTHINIASDGVASGSKHVSDTSMGLSQGTTEQASSVEELTASLEQISVQTRNNADNANIANKLTDDARTNAQKGNTEMKEMLKAMDEINSSSHNISKIIKVIDEIAFQTNILALNAAVEAARAGQHGKGFAVVAEEVRNLAARSANAAKETTDMIEGSIKKVEYGTKIANRTSDALDEIVDGIAKVANLVDGIATASNEQAMGISQVNQGIVQVSNVIQTNSATAEESAASSQELSATAKKLKGLLFGMKLKEYSKEELQRLSQEATADVKQRISNDQELQKLAQQAENELKQRIGV